MGGTPEGVRKMWADPNNRAKIIASRKTGNEKRRQEQKEAFLKAFTETGVIKRALEVTGNGYSSHHHWMTDDPAYRAEFTRIREETAVKSQRYRKIPGVKSQVSREETAQLNAKKRFLEGFEETGLIQLASAQSGVPASQHRKWLAEDADYAEAFNELHEKTRLYHTEYWVTRPRMKAKQQKYIEAVTSGTSLTTACKTAGISKSLHYYWLVNDPEYADAFYEVYKAANSPTKIEEAVALELKRRGIEFYGPRTKVEGWRYEVDIYVPALKLNVEADGTYWHGEENFPGKKAQEARRDAKLNSLGYNVFRLSEAEINTQDWSRLDQEVARLS
jgi:very-short-patch-repair endonuclease